MTLLLSLVLTLSAQTAQPVSGRWVVTGDFFGTVRYAQLVVEADGDKLTGTYNGMKLQGNLTGNQLALSGKSDEGAKLSFTATLQQDQLAGSATGTNPGDTNPYTFKFTAVRLKPIERAEPKRHEFTPTAFYRQYSASTKPVLTVAPGDTIHTTTVDAGGTDEKGIRRVAGGNPQTGPFFVTGAMPGDTLVVRVNRLRLNRDWAVSGDGMVQTSLGPDLARKTKDNGKSIRWHLDLAANTGTPVPASEHMRTFSVPLHPMLGCIAAAPGPGGGAPPTGDSGFYGGNMDFNEITDGATVYLPVSVPGALLYLGDAHALQGDGELNGDALETSMDVEFTVDVIRGKRAGGPRVETDELMMSVGLSGSLDDAFREATDNMASWLMSDYSLNPSEVAQVMGVASQYKVSEVADRNSGIVLKIRKSILATLSR